jgi:hypothetical protein
VPPEGNPRKRGRTAEAAPGEAKLLLSEDDTELTAAQAACYLENCDLASVARRLGEADAVAAEGVATTAAAAAPEPLTCTICMDAPREVVFQPCGHYVACAKCWRTCRTGAATARCPNCRQLVKSWPRVYL